MIDGQSFVPTLRGQSGKRREWIFIQLARQWYVRDAQWKLNQAGELFDMRSAPFEEPLVAPGGMTAEGKAARARLEAALAKLSPGTGILDHGDGSGRHANRENNRKKR